MDSDTCLSFSASAGNAARNKTFSMMRHTHKTVPEEAGIEPAVANYATNGFEDREDHQIPSASIDKRNYRLV